MNDKISREIERKRLWNQNNRKIRMHRILLAARPRCKFCGHSTFSPSGVHPQCQWLHEESKLP